MARSWFLGGVINLAFTLALTNPVLAKDRLSQPTPVFLPLSASAVLPDRANFLLEMPSADARRVADWVVASGDNDHLPFIIVDKIQAKLFVFGSGGTLIGATSVLLGAAHGDDDTPGIGNEKLSDIPLAERTTPAGRFIAEPGRDLLNDVLWIDYGASLALHRVVQSPGNQRLARLATTSPANKRVTYGCVEVTDQFYNAVISKTFAATTGVVYILPETKAVQDVFPFIGNARGIDNAA